MNDDPYGNLLPSSSVLPLPLALLLFLLFFVLGALFAMCESAAETANESRIKKDAESGEPRAKKLLEYLERSAGIISPLQSGMMLMGFFALAVAVTGFAPRLYNVFIRAALPTAAAAVLSALLCTLLCAGLYLTAADLAPKKFVAHKAAHGMQHTNSAPCCAPSAPSCIRLSSCATSFRTVSCVFWATTPKRLMKPSPKKKSSTWSAKARKKVLLKKMSAT